ncbi:hypothetical protein [Streptomyces sp. TS71-3]|uniref:hypothetical protein n=1 Tax=Streptomyces sp. TS71-3 TaxID=2733862 RepID=UPI001B0A9565|nr:hypothetical protein [Streptomyces sp. TS71-3]GHJ35411.1 hypothetical protein Sm713_10200 [Streptomyces sp. TS71-3]
MNTSELAELRTTYIFTPPAGETWGLTFTQIRERLLARDPNEFIRTEDPRAELPGGEASLFFGITLDGGEEAEGIAKLNPEGLAIEESTAAMAAEFVAWARANLIPDRLGITFNTEWGLESDIPDTRLPNASDDALEELFLAHLIDTGGLD